MNRKKLSDASIPREPQMSQKKYQRYVAYTCKVYQYMPM